jgi:AAA domain
MRFPRGGYAEVVRFRELALRPGLLASRPVLVGRRSGLPWVSPLGFDWWPGAAGIITVMLIWVAGVSGSGKSTVCRALRGQGHWAVDADWDGYSHWVHRQTAERLTDPLTSLPPYWLDTYAWRIDLAKVANLRAEVANRRAFLFGTVENEDEVWSLFDLVVCLVIDDETLRRRLGTRTTNQFGKHPDELQAALGWNRGAEARYRGFGARIVDATQRLELVISELLLLAGDGLGCPGS